MKRKICVVTGTRAEYGLLYPLMKKIDQDDAFQLQLVVTGMHLSPEFGLTYEQIEHDGFFIDEKVEMLLSSESAVGVTKAIGLGTISFADTFTRLQPDVVVVLGDRFEIFAATQAAMTMRIAIAHIHGGELTEGLIDDPIRHSITKMAHIHFTANEEYKNRVIQMGEQPQTVFNVGALGIEGIKNTKLLSVDELSKSVELNLDKFFLITLHPTTLEKSRAEMQIKTLLKALDKFPEHQLIFTKANADTDGRVINKYIENYVQQNNNRAKLFDSLGQVRYLSAIKHSDAVIGNSSSGLIEVPFFRKPTIDIGIRQQGRLKATSIISCNYEVNEIQDAIQNSLCEKFQENIKSMTMLYGEGNTSLQIKNILKEIDLQNIIIKKFYDLKR